MQTSKLWILAAAFAAVLMTGHVSMAQYGPYSQAAFSRQPMPDGPPMGGPMGGPMGSPMGGAGMGMSPMQTPVGPGYSCSDSCGSCGDCGDCCGWSQRFHVFGEFLYLRPRDAEVAYASIIDGPIGAGVPGLQAGETGVLDYDYQPGFRLGVGFTLDNCNQIEIAYSQLDATSDDVTAATAPDVIRGLVLAPNSANAGANFLDANATGDLRFQLLDASYRGLISYCSDYEVGYLVGVRYARFEQAFAAEFNNVGTETVVAGVDFDGVGMRFGMDFRRNGHNQQWFVFGKSYASFIGGRFEADYLQGNQGDPVIANTSWEAGRVITMLDLETGIGWQSCSGNVRLSLGYLYSGWFNTIRMNEWIRAVQNNDFVDTGMSTYDSGVTFDGLTARLELLW